MKTALLVEDDLEFCAVMQRFLNDAGYGTVVANDVEKACSLIVCGQSFAVAVIDFWLGRTNAIAVLDHIAVHMPTAPVILISGGNADAASLEMTKAVGELSGAVYFLQKPFSRTNFLQIVQNLD